MDREVHVAPARVFSPPPPMDLSSTTLLPSMTLLLMNSLTSFLWFVATVPTSMMLCEDCWSCLSIIFEELFG
ncbi:hypothetical protein TB2_017025 [Malus domestica]